MPETPELRRSRTTWRADKLLDSRDIRLLTEIGFLASARGDVVRAESIFGALLHFRPEKAFPHVGVAIALMNAGRFDEAASRLGAVRLPAGPDADLVQAMHGMALQLQGRISQSQGVLHEVASRRDIQGPPSDGVRLARRLLGYSAHNQSIR